MSPFHENPRPISIEVSSRPPRSLRLSRGNSDEDAGPSSPLLTSSGAVRGALPAPISFSPKSRNKLSLSSGCCNLSRFFVKLFTFFLCVLGAFLILKLLHIQLIPANYYFGAGADRQDGRSREAYVTFLGHVDGQDIEQRYFHETRRLMFQTMYDPKTLDPSVVHRDFVVVTAPGVPDRQKDRLRAEGAIIKPRDAITSLPEDDENPESRWLQTYTKLHTFNLTQYDRVLYLDADIFLVRSLKEVWDDANAWPSSGLAAMSETWEGEDHEIPIPPASTFNSGFMMIRPNATTLDQILQVTDYNAHFTDQAILNKFFELDGSHPWQSLDHKFCSTHPTETDLSAGIYSLHEKMWYSHVQEPLRRLWELTLARMDGFWLAKSPLTGIEAERESDTPVETEIVGNTELGDEDRNEDNEGKREEIEVN
ncbi:hypothetical protein I317_04310 [Kwoniella heveanensis CBS 569]|nr:hypothetical protein I317_04310 [Kwoniella heveanensis CBS 569]